MAKNSDAKDKSANLFGAFAELPNGAGLDAAVTGQKMAAEAAGFMAKRMRAYADYLEQLTHCKSPVEFTEVQSQFVSRLQSDYLAEGTLISKMVGGAAKQKSDE